MSSSSFSFPSNGSPDLSSRVISAQTQSQSSPVDESRINKNSQCRVLTINKIIEIHDFSDEGKIKKTFFKKKFTMIFSRVIIKRFSIWTFVLFYLDRESFYNDSGEYHRKFFLKKVFLIFPSSEKSSFLLNLI
jgi:hypothetical protein